MKRKMFGGAEKPLFRRANELHRQQTFAEILWSYLRTKPLGFKFRRQHPFSNYILDFYCHALKLVIEVDGSMHELEEVKKYDEVRHEHLEAKGMTMLRFKNDNIRLKPEEIIETIEFYLQSKTRTK